MEGRAKKKSKQEKLVVRKLHRFQSFTERIANIRINVAHRVEPIADSAENDQDTFFGGGLQKWRELNCTTDFVAFSREVHTKASSLAQLVHHKDEIVGKLKQYLAVKNTLAYEPLLDLLVQLARDLQLDFYPYFKDFFPILVSMTDTQDAGVIQCVFTSLAYLFKFLWRYMVKDIERVFKLHSGLLHLSTKTHIRQFAVESFGFLLRKVHDHDGLFDMIFKHLSENSDLTEGVGQLLFEMVKGVPKQFHSCTDDVLPLLLVKLGSPCLSSELVFQALSKMVGLMAEHTRKEFAEPVWKPLLGHLSKLHTRLRTVEDPGDVSVELSHTLHLVGIMVSWRKGTRVTSSTAVVEAVVSILTEPSLKLEVLSVAIHLAASLILITPNLPECHTHISTIVRGVCVGRVAEKEEVELVISFFQELAEKYHDFETDILAECLAYCNSVIQEKENQHLILKLLTELCLHFEPPRYLPHHQSNSSTIFLMEVGSSPCSSRPKRKKSSQETIVSILSKIVACGQTWVPEIEVDVLGGSEREGVMEESMEVDGVEDGTLEQLWASVVILKHIRPPLEQTTSHLLDLYSHVRELVVKKEAMSGKVVFLLSQCLSTLVRLMEDDLDKLMEAVPLSDVISLLKSLPDSLPLLTSVEEYLSILSLSDEDAPVILSSDWLREFLPVLQCNLTSPHPLVRLVTLRILCSFEQLPLHSETGSSDKDAEGSVVDILEVCLRAEELSTDLDTYRNKFLWLNKLKYRPHSFALLPSIYKEVPLRYLIGALYVNFSLIWEPVIEIISSYAVEENKKMFWTVFGYFLERASEVTESPSLVSHSKSVDSLKWHSSIATLFQYQYVGVARMERGRVDYANFRLLLWKCVSGLNPTLAEPRSRVLVPLVLRFVKEEYSLQEDNLMDTQDLRSAPRVCGPTDDPSITVEGQAGLKSARGPRSDAGGHRKGLYKTLTAMLSAFSKFKNPKTFYRQEEFKQLCMKLLTHKFSEMQQLALSCLMTYKPPHLLPYQENFERLLDDQSYREELINFSSDSSCSVVATEHREQLLPVLIRILYGRMQKQGGHDSSKSGGASRKGTVLRFLGGCEESDMSEFINLLILPFQEMKVLSSSNLELHLVSMVNPSCVIPLKKQQGFLNLFGQMISVVGSKVKNYLRVLFPILLNMGAACASLLEQRNEIQPHFVTALKALRQLVVSRVSECFDVFLDYDFGAYLEWIFSCIIWPQLPRLPHECVQSPTPILKLLHTWTSHPQYFHLLKTPVPPSLLSASHPRDLDREASDAPPVLDGSPPSHILGIVYSCLFSTGVNVSVCNYIMEMTLNLLIDDSEDGKLVEVADRSSIVDGADLVRPFIPQLLKYIGQTVRANLKKEKLKSSLHMEFAVLSKISVFVKNTSESTLLVQLLLPFLTKFPIKYKKYEEEILLALNSLICCTENMAVICRPLSELFSTLNERKSRTLLCNIFVEMGKKDGQWKSTAATLVKLNSWDSKRIEEPDYELRLEGFAEASSRLLTHKQEQNGSSWTTALNTTLPVVHNALFYLIKSEDMSIRDAAASYISNLIKSINPQDGEAYRVLILGAALNAVKEGLRSKAEFARHESISILSQLVKAYPTHTRFSDMTALSHKETEADFFENVKHIQLHRRTRAFKKLAGVCSEATVSQASYMGFLLPLANQVIFHPSTNVEQNLVGEAINVIGAISSHLNWTNYYFLLTHYLRQLPKQIEIQRSLVKAVVAVLDNFHFDLSFATSKDLENDQSPQDENRSELSTQTKAPDGTIPTMSGSDSPETPPTGPESLVDCEELLPGEEAAQEDVLTSEGVELLPGEEVAQKDVLKSEGVDMEKSRAFVKKILKSIMNSVLPGLQSALTKRIDVAGHKLSSLGQDEDSEILRVPVALAMTKLLLALPEETLHAQLPGLLLKVCQTLKNRSRDVRDVGRSTLVKMATALGPKYLQFVIRQMKDTLTRGYMLHVLSYSLHALLRGITHTSPTHPSTLHPGDLDSCLELISSILVEDLFGVPAEERESGGNVAKIPESKTPQSYNCYEMTAQYLTPGLLPDFLAPVKQMLQTQCTARSVRVVEEIFRRVGLGIHANESFTPQALLVFVHGALSDSIPQLANEPRSKVAPPTVSLVSRPPDSRLLPPTPQRTGAKAIVMGNTGASVVTEFGMHLLYVALKRGKFDTSSEEQLQMLDPFVSLLTDSLSSRHVKVLSRALQCLVWTVRMPLPSLDTHIDVISTHLFELLRRYARAGAAVGSNRELVLSAFKAMTVIVRDFKKYTVSEDELRLLLSFVEEDIHDYQRQSTAFPLLKAILARKLVVSEAYDVMHKVSQLSVTADSEHVRQQCRQAVLLFLMDYPLGKKLNRYLDFYISNLSYEGQSGRESVLELFSSMFTKFPAKILHRHSSYFFVPLASQLINDESPTCRQMVSETIKLLLKRLDSARINDVSTMISVWLCSDNLTHRRLGAQTLGLLIEVEGQSFEKRISTYLPLLTNCLTLYDPSASEDDIVLTVASSHDVSHDGSSIVTSKEDTHSDDKDNVIELDINSEEELEDMDVDNTNLDTNGLDEEEPEISRPSELEQTPKVTLAILDHLLFAVLCTVRKLCVECSVLRATEFSKLMNELWSKVRPLLLHPHAWTRLASSQLYGLLFAAYTPDDLVDLVDLGAETHKKKKKGNKDKQDVKTKVMEEYLLNDTVTKVQDLCNAFCMQLWSPLLNTELAGQAVKNLVFGAKVIHRFQLSGKVPSDSAIPLTKDHSDEGTQGGTTSTESSRGLSWLIGRLARLARFEAGHHPKDSQKRTCVLQWTAAVCVDLGQEHLPTYLPSMLGPLYRELADSTKRGGEELHSLAHEVVDLMKSVCGREAFSRAYAQVHQSVLSMREKRRKQAALEAVADPEKSIRRKHKKNELKKASKKMKILQYRPDSTAAVIANRKSKQRRR